MPNYPRFIGDPWKTSTSTCADKYIMHSEEIGVIRRIQSIVSQNGGGLL
jgi:hypothetical protein